MNAPDPYHWTLNSCFGAFLFVQVHFGPFRYCTKLGAKRAKLVQLMQKFVQQCLVRLFWNERSRSTPLDPKLMLWCVSFRLGAFGTVSLLHKTCCKTRQTGAINAKFRPRCLVRIFGNEHSQSTLLDPKLMFWCVSFHSDVFWTVSLLHETWCKSAKLVQLMQKFVPWYLIRIFATNAPDTHHWTLNSCFGAFLSVWGHLEPFCYCMKLAAKRAKLVQVMQKFVRRCLVRSFCNESSRSTLLDPKLMFGCVSIHSGAFGNSFATTRNLVQNAPY